MATNDIKKFAIMSEFRPKDANDILKELKQEGKINYFDTNNKETKSFYMAKKPRGISIFKYIS